MRFSIYAKEHTWAMVLLTVFCILIAVLPKHALKPVALEVRRKLLAHHMLLEDNYVAENSNSNYCSITRKFWVDQSA